MSAEEILLDAEDRMEKAVDVLKKNLAGIRTGRANPGLVDTLRVEESENGKAPACTCLAWSADGSTLFAGYTDNIIRVYAVTAA